MVSDDKVVVTVKTTSVANGQKFEDDFLEFELDKYDEIGDVRNKLCMRLHGDGVNYEEAQEYTDKVTIKMVAIIDTKPTILGSFKSTDDTMSVVDFIAKFDLDKFDWYFQMPMNTKWVGGGT